MIDKHDQRIKLVDPPLVTSDQVGYLGIITKRPAAAAAELTDRKSIKLDFNT